MATRQHALQLIATARKLDERILLVARRRNRDKLELAALLLDMDEGGLARALGYESVASYAEDRVSLLPSTTRQLVALARRIREWPELAAVAATGEFTWTVLRTIASAATNATLPDWVEKARELTRDSLERRAREVRGERPVERLTLEVTREELEDIRLAVAEVRREEPEVSLGSAVARICRGLARARVGGDASTSGAASPSGSGSSAPAPRVQPRLVIHTCGSCERSTRQTREGSLEVTPAAAEQVACDAEILDIRQGQAALRRALPPKLANYVDGRDLGRCRVPGCVNRVFLERHHEGGWREVGHSPEHVYTLCVAHHTARHEGSLVVEGSAEGELTFRLADGSQPGARRGWSARENVSRETNRVVETESVRLARAALLKLEFRRDEVQQRVAVALERVGPEATVDVLVGAALRASS